MSSQCEQALALQKGEECSEQSVLGPWTQCLDFWSNGYNAGLSCERSWVQDLEKSQHLLGGRGAAKV